MTTELMPWNEEYEAYLRDESRSTGHATAIAFPRSESDVIAVVNDVRDQGDVLTTQGARTGIAGGAIPQGGHILNLSRMNAIGEVKRDALGGCTITVQPGALLQQVREAIAPHGLFFPPDPTETSASIGGMVACNASGAVTFGYGAMRRWVTALRIVLSDGSVLALRRGEQYAQGRSFTVRTEDGTELRGTLPSYLMPAVKNASGYYAADDMDLIDLFIGMEGTLGVITEVELKLLPSPSAILGLVAFLPSEDHALAFVRALRGEAVAGCPEITIRPVAIEFFNQDALRLLRRMKADHAAFAKLPTLKPHYHTAIYVELHAASEDDLDAQMMPVLEAMATLGGNEDDTWCGTTPRELEPLKAFRHATPEAVNLLIDHRRSAMPDLTKLGTDMSAPDAALGAVMAVYRTTLEAAGLESVMFGHIGNNHIHVNILPRSMEEYERGKALYLSWAEQVAALGGAVSAEHGIGKLKIPLLRLMYGEEGIAQMRAVKAVFDAQSMLNPGTLLHA